VYSHAISGAGSGARAVDGVRLIFSILAKDMTIRIANFENSGDFTLELIQFTPGWDEKDKKLRGPVPWTIRAVKFSVDVIMSRSLTVVLNIQLHEWAD